MRFSIVTFLALLALSIGSAEATARSVNRWPAKEERSVINNCHMTGGGALEPCRCLLRWLEHRYTYQQIAMMYRRDPLRQWNIVRRGTRACIK